MENIFIRGSTIRYINLPENDIDLDSLKDATLKEFK